MNRAISRIASACILLGATLCTAEDSFFDSDGVLIHFVEQGKGEPVVLIHGFTGSLQQWNVDNIMGNLAQDYRVIALDCRGHGLSGKPHDPKEYGPKMGDDVIRLLDHLNLQKAHMVGYSMGAHIVGRLLVTHPERISSATLGAGVFPNWNAEEEKFIEETAKATEERGRTGQQLPWETEEQDFAALAACARGARYEAVTDDEIAGVTIPVLAIFGSEEVDEYATVDMKRLTIPKSSLPLLIVDGAAHVGENATYRQPEFLQAIRELVQSNSGSKPN